LLDLSKYMSLESYIPYKDVKSRYGVSRSTLKNWEEQGLINPRRTVGGKRFYQVKDLEGLFTQQGQTIQEGSQTGQVILYARVSSSGQKDDLQRQIIRLISEYPQARLIQDIGSGLNFKRPGFQTLLDTIMREDVSEIVVSNKDRLCRFGYELFEQVCRRRNTKIRVLDVPYQQQNGRNEVVEDILAILNFYVARENGLRAGLNRRERLQKEKNRSSDEQESESEEEGSW
jgi:putative resolvase